MRYFSFTQVLAILLLVIAGFGVAPANARGSPSENLYCGPDDCYAVLEVEKTATTAEIKKAYHKLSLK